MEFKEEEPDLVCIAEKNINFRLLDYNLPVDDREMRTINFIIENIKIIESKAEEKLLKFYSTAYPDYKEGMESGGGDYSSLLPEPEDLIAFRDALSDREFYLPPKGEYGEKEFGIVFDCTWDVEHGIGARFKNLECIDAGHNDVAFF